MKFALELQLNAVDGWREHYIAYSRLKRLVYAAERDLSVQHYGDDVVNNADTKASDRDDGDEHEYSDGPVSDIEAEGSARALLLSPRHDASSAKPAPTVGSASNSRGTASFLGALDRELQKVCGFFVSTEMQATSILEQLRVGNVAAPEAPALLERLCECYAMLANLRRFVDLNHTGFSKILKKFDKNTRSNLRFRYLRSVADAYPFRADTAERLVLRLAQVERLYAIINPADPAALLRCVRERVALARDSVWRSVVTDRHPLRWIDPAPALCSALHQSRPPPPPPESRPIQQAQRGSTPQLSTQEQNLPQSTPLSRSLSLASAQASTAPAEARSFTTAFLWLRLAHVSSRFGILGAIVAAISFSYAFAPTSMAPCAAVLLVTSVLWATEALPLHVTALAVPLLLVISGALRDPVSGEAVPAPEAATLVITSMFSPVIVLLLGGFSIAAALSKHGIATLCATAVLNRATSRPSHILLAIMAIAFTLSMLISNVAAPVLCFSIIQPILRTLPPHGAPIAKALILGVALASNVGGMGSPIASPQNVIGLGNMVEPVSWFQWLAVSLPVSAVSVLMIWRILVALYKPDAAVRSLMPLPRPTDDRLTLRQWYIVTVTGLTVALWCADTLVSGMLGGTAIVALVPLVVFGASGILSKDDVNSFLWTVVLLAMGGIALGRAVASCGLLALLAAAVGKAVAGLAVWPVVLLVSALLLVAATVISHTVAALIVLPIVAEVGAALQNGRDDANETGSYARLLVFCAALVCSAGMALPVSGFPNMSAAAQEDSTGRPYLCAMDFIKVGVPATLCVWLAIITVGYGLMLLLQI